MLMRNNLGIMHLLGDCNRKGPGFLMTRSEKAAKDLRSE